jgi:hypothetical protein
MKNQGGNQYGMAFFQKNSILNHLKSLKGWSLSSLNQINILIDFLFEMLFFSFVLKNHRHEWTCMFSTWAPKLFLGVGTFLTKIIIMHLKCMK